MWQFQHCLTSFDAWCCLTFFDICLLESQVYIVTMEQEKNLQKQKHSKQRLAPNVGGLSPADDVDEEEGQEFGDYAATDAESLLSLVQPEMKMLSHHWLAALKDYALLSLPPGLMFTFAFNRKWAVYSIKGPRMGPGYPFCLFITFCLFPFLIYFTYFLLLSIPSLSTGIFPLRFLPTPDFVCDIAIIVLKGDIKLQLTNYSTKGATLALQLYFSGFTR